MIARGALRQARQAEFSVFGGGTASEPDVGIANAMLALGDKELHHSLGAYIGHIIEPREISASGKPCEYYILLSSSCRRLAYPWRKRPVR